MRHGNTQRTPFGVGWARAAAAAGLLGFVCAGGVTAQPIDRTVDQTTPRTPNLQTPPPVPRTDPGAATNRRSIRERIGYPSAADRLGRSMPTGAGVVFAHVEGNAGAYRPELTGPSFDAVAFSLASGPSEPSAHATSTARVIYGGRGLAPGVEIVHCMTTNDFLTGGYLRADTPGPPLDEDPTPFPPRVFNHSWIGNPPPPQAEAILRRVDHQIDHRGVVMCVGVNNGRDTPVPGLLASAYNVIAVGTTSGQNSGGYTEVDGGGRCKPDLIAPNGQTSYTTPVVAACAALLLEQGDRLVEKGHAHANRPEVIKAALMGGAHKDDAWSPALDKPLDEFKGAGEVNIDRSLRILSGAPLEPDATMKRLFGWAAPTVKPQGQVTYHLKLPGKTGRATFTLVWNRRINGQVVEGHFDQNAQPISLWVNQPDLADLDLRLISLHDGQETVLAQSVSRIDNVELITLPSLPKGEYRLEVFRDRDHEVSEDDWLAALAWAIDKPRPVAKPAAPAAE